MLILELFKNRLYFCELLGLGPNLPGGREGGRVTSEGILQPKLRVFILGTWTNCRQVS